MNAHPLLDFQILTKRAQRMAILAKELSWSPNIWQGVSVENQGCDFRFRYLRNHPAGIHFVSAEPLIGPLDLSAYLDDLNWVIVGGESGPKARPMNLTWAWALRDQCIDAKIPFFYKQSGAHHQCSHEECGTKGCEYLDGKAWKQFPVSTT